MRSDRDYYTAMPAEPSPPDFETVAQRLFLQVFRTDFTAPGVALLSFGQGIESSTLRSHMIKLKESLGVIYRRVMGKGLMYLSMARFNQQVTTKFHLDGAPDEAYLMLGYEPTAVQSRVAIADYSRAAHDWGIDPKRLLSDHNPMYANHETRLLPYVTRLDAFDPAVSQILLINNSSLSYRPNEKQSLGVMHQATIVTPLPSENRVVNSMMIGSTIDPSAEAIPGTVVQEFIETQAIAGAIGM